MGEDLKKWCIAMNISGKYIKFYKNITFIYYSWLEEIINKVSL